MIDVGFVVGYSSDVKVVTIPLKFGLPLVIGFTQPLAKVLNFPLNTALKDVALTC